MIKLLNIELKKSINYPTFWIFSGILAGLFLLSAFIIAVFEIDFMIGMGTQSNSFNFKNIFQFPHVWNTLAWIASWFNILLTLLIIIQVTNEFAYRTFRQHIIDGLQRNELLIGKLLLIFTIAIAFTLLVFIASFSFGLIFSDKLENLFTKIYYLPVYLLQTISYMAFGLMIAILFKNTGLSIIVYFGYLIFEAIIRLILRLLETDLFRYLPMKVISGLTPSPKIEVILGSNPLQNTAEQVTEVSLGTHAILSIVYTSIFILISFMIVKKRNF